MRDQIFIKYGIGCLSSHKVELKIKPSPKAVRSELQHIRDLSSAHWAHLQVGRRRVDDDQIASVLGRSR